MSMIIFGRPQFCLCACAIIALFAPNRAKDCLLAGEDNDKVLSCCCHHLQQRQGSAKLVKLQLAGTESRPMHRYLGEARVVAAAAIPIRECTEQPAAACALFKRHPLTAEDDNRCSSLLKTTPTAAYTMLLVLHTSNICPARTFNGLAHARDESR